MTGLDYIVDKKDDAEIEAHRNIIENLSGQTYSRLQKYRETFEIIDDMLESKSTVDDYVSDKNKRRRLNIIRRDLGNYMNLINELSKDMIAMMELYKKSGGRLSGPSEEFFDGIKIHCAPNAAPSETQEEHTFEEYVDRINTQLLVSQQKQNRMVKNFLLIPEGSLDSYLLFSDPDDS